ncbi:MAG TPA: acyl-CoA dehydrogenase family protein [Phototrophicaceae bacterium]|jgi:glutaryl-CoA dehydrogenase|nr:acyl-CoA dehydrogenase family protein [Phototrophicaceae bacterium]
MLNEKELTAPAGFDFLKMDSFLMDQHRDLRMQVREFVQHEVLPTINQYWEKAEFPRDIAMKLKDLPIVGGMIRGWGSAGLDPMAMGIVMYELAKGDGSLTTFFGVHSGLAMGSIGLLGSNEQRERWLPAMGRLEKIGAFALTEPERGSNAVDIQTTVTRDDDYYVLNGAKRWIGNASIADIIIVWARDAEGNFGGFVLEDPQHTEGVTITDIQGKIGKRAILNADIVLNNVRIPLENKLAKANSSRDMGKVLVLGRYGVSWEAAGAAAAAFEYALDYAKNREQFGKPIASFQLIQQKLVEMATEVTLMQLMCFQLGNQVIQGTLTEGMASMAKYNNARKARQVAMLARETMGGNGLLIENHVARLMMDIEVIYTYEGSNEVQTLIVGRELTGINAFM